MNQPPHDAITAHPAHKTAAWQLLSVPEKTRLKQLKRRAAEAQLHQHTPATSFSPDKPLKVGDRVWWDDCFGNPTSWNPFVIRQILGDMVWLDYVAVPVHRSKLFLWNGGQRS